jgi:uncharacterized membrane protein YhaH (DUF805 family)
MVLNTFTLFLDNPARGWQPVERVQHLFFKVRNIHRFDEVAGMRETWWKWLFVWEGRVQRWPYFLTATILIAVKFAIDSSVAARYGESWKIWNYCFPFLNATLFDLGARQPQLFGILWAIAIPFFWVGIALTMRRLRDAGRPIKWVFLFFVPLVNLGLFLWLTFAPSDPDAARSEGFSEKDLTRSARTGWAGHGIVFAAALGIVMVALSTRVLMQYSWGLFLGVPFLTGFVASWFLNAKSVQSKLNTLLVSAATPFVIGIALLGLRWEGLVCLLMALPLALPFSMAGGLVAREILRGRTRATTPPSFAASLAMLPLIMFGEHAAKVQPPVVAVTTSITIDAPVSVVWKNVIAFPPLAVPEEWMFRAGIAYPTSARIVGLGSGAIRYCRFSTGDFVEPITVWDENHLLAFDVSAQPPAMRELSPWKISPAHLERNYMLSRRGQFRLVALSDQRTLLEGTTWYQDFFWPQAYWRGWSDEIVHRIHLRVLQHVKQQAEASFLNQGRIVE